MYFRTLGLLYTKFMHFIMKIEIIMDCGFLVEVGHNAPFESFHQ